MADDADDATSQLIARLLAEDEENPYLNTTSKRYLSSDDDNDDDDDDEDVHGQSDNSAADSDEYGFGNARRKRRAKASLSAKPPTKRARKSSLATGEKKKRKSPMAWTPDEETRFLEALEIYGRDWVQAAVHLGTRDKHAFKSHAQKHFIRLWRDSIPLPEKVQESGAGYTLSGKPLDPDSAAVKMYLGLDRKNRQNSKIASTTPRSNRSGISAPAIKAENTTSTKGDAGQPASSSADLASPSSSAGLATGAASPALSALAASKTAKPTATAQQKAGVTSPSRRGRPTQAKTPNEQSNNRVASRREAKASERYRPPASAASSAASTDAADASLRRSRRSTTTRAKFLNLEEEDDPLRQIECLHFKGSPGSRDSNSQPFTISVSSEVMLMCDFHSHLCTNEIIGLLGGDWDPDTRSIRVRSAFPCRSVAHGSNHVQVEMDPESEVQVRSTIQEQNMRVVGWYHSHPDFCPDPSVRDIDNQSNYQNLFRDDDHRIEPFVGAIIGPYDIRLPNEQSAFNWFYVRNTQEFKGIPMFMEHTVDSLPLFPNSNDKQLNWISSLTSIRVLMHS